MNRFFALPFDLQVGSGNVRRKISAQHSFQTPLLWKKAVEKRQWRCLLEKAGRLPVNN